MITIEISSKAWKRNYDISRKPEFTIFPEGGSISRVRITAGCRSVWAMAPVRGDLTLRDLRFCVRKPLAKGQLLGKNGIQNKGWKICCNHLKTSVRPPVPIVCPMMMSNQPYLHYLILKKITHSHTEYILTFVECRCSFRIANFSSGKATEANYCQSNVSGQICG